MRKFINITTRLIVTLIFVAPVAYTTHLLDNDGIAISTAAYWFTVAPTAFICGVAWGVLDSKLEKEL